MKYTVYAALLAACALTLVACGEKKAGEENPPMQELTPAPVEPTPEPMPAPTPEPMPAPAPEAPSEAPKQ